MLWLEIVNSDHLASHPGTGIRVDIVEQKEWEKERVGRGQDVCACVF